MAVPNFADLDLKLASAEASLLFPKRTELGSVESFSVATPVMDDLVTPTGFSKMKPSFPSEYGGSSNMQNGSWSKLLNVETPTPISQKQPAKSVSETQPSKRGRKKRGSAVELTVVLDPSKNPAWLPPGWKVVTRTRPNGKSAGSKDTYYHEPIRNRQFRSKREVLDFINSGSRVKSNKKLKTKEDKGSPSASKSSQRLDSEQATPPFKPPQISTPIQFDSAYPYPPEKVKWVLGNSAGNMFTPFIGEEMVPEHVRLHWAAMFNPLAHSNAV